MSETSQLKPEIAAAFDRLGAVHPTKQDLYTDRKPVTQEAPPKEIVFLLPEDSITYSRIQTALTDMEAEGYRNSPTYIIFLSLLGKIESGELSGEAAFKAFADTVVLAQQEMAANPPSPRKEAPVPRDANTRKHWKLPGFMQALFDKNA